MSVCAFTSESYSAPDRIAAWQDSLGALGLRSSYLAAAHGLHATAFRRESPDGVIVARLGAGPQTLSPASQNADLPLILMSLEEGAALKAGDARHALCAGDLAVLPRQEAWEFSFKREMHVVALSVGSSAYHGRKIGSLSFGRPRIVRAEGLTAVLARSLDAAAESLEILTAAEWATLSQALAEMLLTLLRQPTDGSADAGGTTVRAALLHRIYQTIERSLDDPELTPARVAQAEGISERYLQKLFETTGDNFTLYLRQRRLHRTRDELANPANASQSVSEIAFRCGFNDAAHFSRAFRERFGLSPREFRRQEAERLAEPAGPHSQRGWPQKALTQLRARRGAARNALSGSTSGGATGAVAAETTPRHHHLHVTAAHVHWGYFSHSLRPIIEIKSGDTVTVETLTQHASDDSERMIVGDPGAESVFRWTRNEKSVDRRGAGPMDASIYGRGAGEGFGVHICTGPIAVKDAQPGDVLEVRILDMTPRPSRNPKFAGRAFGSNVAAWWGYHYPELLTEPRPREVVTIYEIVTDAGEPYLRADYSYQWTPQTDPFGVTHKTYDYPGVPVRPDSVTRRHNVLDGVRIPLRPHFGVIAVAPRESDLVDSVPPSYFGGNLDNWRLGKGATVYLPVSVAGALLSVGDPHAAQGDGELGGTAVECSMTGTFKVLLHKKADLHGRPFGDVTYPLIETESEWVLTGFSHPNYLAEFGPTGQSEVYAKSSLDLAMKDAFRKVRRFLMNARGLTEDEAIALMSAAVDFGVTQVVDGNWGVHAIISKRLFADRSSR
ncbi:MAG TPA: acetamidase/formamidase family protein [Pseudolabrys sp.]|nr:acetamidase/formamidase family protein [Pseudolabrys sp.]